MLVNTMILKYIKVRRCYRTNSTIRVIQRSSKIPLLVAAGLVNNGSVRIDAKHRDSYEHKLPQIERTNRFLTNTADRRGIHLFVAGHVILVLLKNLLIKGNPTGNTWSCSNCVKFLIIVKVLVFLV